MVGKNLAVTSLWGVSMLWQTEEEDEDEEEKERECDRETRIMVEE